jgi:hypothetical protein
LFKPNDRTAQNGAATVRTAVYFKAASANGQEQLEADAVGWTSVSE